MEKQEQDKPQVTRGQIFALVVKDIKKDLPSSCTHLAPHRKANGEYKVRAIIDGTTYLFPTPEDLLYDQTQLSVLTELINDKLELSADVAA